MTVGPGEAVKSGATVGGNRCAGNIDRAGVAATRIVVGHHNLQGVLRINRSECLRLRDIGKGLRMVDQVDVGPAVRQGCQQSLEKPADGTKSGSRRRRNTGHLAAGHHDGASTEVFLLVDAQLMNFGTVKSNRNERVCGAGDNLILLLRLCDARSNRGKRAKTCQRQKDAGQDYEQAN